MSQKVDPKKISPGQKTFIEAKTGASVATEQDINAVQDPGLQQALVSQNETAIAQLNDNDLDRVRIGQLENELGMRSPSNSSSAGPIIQGPTKAQDTFSLRQAPATLMSGVPRMKFEYLATFRFTNDRLFEDIFSNADVDALDGEIQQNRNISDAYAGGPPGRDSYYRAQANDLKQKRSSLMDAIRRSLVFNIKQIDGPRINFQYDTLNQYNRKRNVYRRVDYDPVTVRFYDTMNNSALKLFRYLYELNLKDGRNRHKDYGGIEKFNRGLYQPNSLSASTEQDFVDQHSFGLESSVSNTTYPIKSLDLFLIHGTKYNLIRFIHPKVVAMDHDVLTYESSQPIEIGMQFAYETVVYETLNHDMSEAKDVAIDFDIILENSLTMPETPISAEAVTEGKDGTTNNEYDWTKLTSSSGDSEISSASAGSGSNVMQKNNFLHDIQSAGAAFGAGLQNISGTPISDGINSISSAVYGAARSAVSGFGVGGSSTGGGGGLGDLFASHGPGDGRYNPDSSNYQGKNTKTNVSANGKVIKDKNQNVKRKGTNAPGGGAYNR